MVPISSSKELLGRAGLETSYVKYGKGAPVFSQGGPCDAVFFIQSGQIKLSVMSEHGKEAIIAILQPGALFGEQCLAGHALRIATATALEDTSLVRVEKGHMLGVLSKDRELSDYVVSHLLTRTARYEEDLIDQLFNSSEKRLARLLLILANFGKEHKSEPVLTDISQETLAEMIGTTRSRVSHFMNKFRKLGFIQYNGKIIVNSSLLHVVLNEKTDVESAADEPEYF